MRRVEVVDLLDQGTEAAHGLPIKRVGRARVERDADAAGFGVDHKRRLEQVIDARGHISVESWVQVCEDEGLLAQSGLL